MSIQLHTLSTDAFLQTIETAITKLGDLVRKIQNKMNNEIINTISLISDVYLFEKQILFVDKMVFICSILYRIYLQLN